MTTYISARKNSGDQMTRTEASAKEILGFSSIHLITTTNRGKICYSYLYLEMVTAVKNTLLRATWILKQEKLAPWEDSHPTDT